MAVIVTEEMRRAVYADDCERLGHILVYDNALRFDVGHNGARVAGPDGRQAHVTCRRCSRVWLVIEESGDDYASATVALDARLLPEHRRPRPSAAPIAPDDSVTRGR